MRGHQSFGKFVAQYHDLQRAFKAMEKKYERQIVLLDLAREDLFHASHILRLGGYTTASERLINTFRQIADHTSGVPKS